MRRKQLSMKALHQYAMDYFKIYYSKREIITKEEAENSIEYKAVVNFIDYIWKNPK